MIIPVTYIFIITKNKFRFSSSANILVASATTSCQFFWGSWRSGKQVLQPFSIDSRQVAISSLNSSISLASYFWDPGKFSMFFCGFSGQQRQKTLVLIFPTFYIYQKKVQIQFLGSWEIQRQYIRPEHIYNSDSGNGVPAMFTSQSCPAILFLHLTHPQSSVNVILLTQYWPGLISFSKWSAN